MMTNQQIHECASAVVVVALNAYAGEQLEKRANDLALPLVGVGAFGLGAAGAGFGSGLAGLLSGTPRDAEEEARLKNRKRLAALALGIPGAALGGYLGNRLGTGSGTLEDVMAKLSPEAIKGYWAKLRGGNAGNGDAPVAPVDPTVARNKAVTTIGSGIANPDADEMAIASLTAPPAPPYDAGKHQTADFLAGVGGGATPGKALDRVNDTTMQAIQAHKWNTAGMAPNYMRTQLDGNLR